MLDKSGYTGFFFQFYKWENILQLVVLGKLLWKLYFSLWSVVVLRNQEQRVCQVTTGAALHYNMDLGRRCKPRLGK